MISARGPSEREIQAVETIVPEIKQQYDLKICACLGLLDADQANRLKACGVDRVNHNLNTSEQHYEQICSTHTYRDRLDTLKHVRDAGIEICSGGIIGMGEADEDIVRMAFELRDLDAESIPVNFLNPIDIARTFLLLQLDISALMGYTGAVFSKFFGGWMGMTTALGVLVMWTLVPLLVALRIFRSKDF